MKTTKPSSLPALQNSNDSKPPANLPAHSTGREPPQRTVAWVRDLRNGGDALVPVAAVLDPLGAAGFSKLRVDTAAAHAAGEALFRCGECNAPVHPRIRRDGTAGDGRDGYMAHYPGSKECPWHTGDAVHNPGGAMLAGQQEGSQHQQLKALLAQCLSQDPGFTDIAVEQRITSEAGWRTPDVSADYQGKPVAFEIQLMRPLLGTLAEREAFYAGIGMHLVWVTAEQILQRPMTQAFRDLILSSGGRIFVLDHAAADRSQWSEAFHLREYTLEPALVEGYPLFNRWRKDVVSMEVVLMDKDERTQQGQVRYGQQLDAQLREKAAHLIGPIKQAIGADQPLRLVERQWRGLTQLAGGATFERALLDEVPLVLAWLYEVEQLRVIEPTRIQWAEQAIQQKLATILNARTAPNWVGLVELVAGELPTVAKVITPKMQATMDRLKSQPGKRQASHLVHRHMLSALYPWLSFWLLAKPPKGKTVSKKP